MTEVNELVAFSPPLRFPLFAPVPLFSRTANVLCATGSASGTRRGYERISWLQRDAFCVSSEICSMVGFGVT